MRLAQPHNNFDRFHISKYGKNHKSSTIKHNTMSPTESRNALKSLFNTRLNLSRTIAKDVARKLSNFQAIG